MTRQLAGSSFSTRSEDIEVTQSLALKSMILPEPVRLNDPVITQGLAEDKVKLVWTSYHSDDYREYKVYAHSMPGLDETTGELIYVATNPTDTTFETVLPHSSKMYYRVFVLSETSLLAGSNLAKAATQGYANPTSIDIDTETAFYLNAGETIWVKFAGEKGEFYKVAWYDKYMSEPFSHIPGYTVFGNYTASTILVSCYRADKQTAYFREAKSYKWRGHPCRWAHGTARTFT